jgi:hypothetical protein
LFIQTRRIILGQDTAYLALRDTQPLTVWYPRYFSKRRKIMAVNLSPALLPPRLALLLLLAARYGNVVSIFEQEARTHLLRNTLLLRKGPHLRHTPFFAKVNTVHLGTSCSETDRFCCITVIQCCACELVISSLCLWRRVWTAE